MLNSPNDFVTTLAQTGVPAYHYHQPFLQPLPAWDYWYLLLLPLCAGVSIVYKCIKCRSMRQVPREATVIFLWIVGGMVAAALALVALVRLVTK